MTRIRKTRQKELLESNLSSLNKLFTADELLAEAKKHDPSIGIATVYRFLKDNSKKKKLHSYECNRRKIYSSQADNHCHFTCQRCKKVEHFNLSEVGFLKNKLKGDICHFQIDVSGICEKCRKEQIKGSKLLTEKQARKRLGL